MLLLLLTQVTVFLWTELAAPLRRFQQLTGLRHEDAELDLGVRGPDMLDDPLASLDVLRDLHRRRSRRRPHPPDEHHTTTLEPPPSA